MFSAISSFFFSKEKDNTSFNCNDMTNFYQNIQTFEKLFKREGIRFNQPNIQTIIFYKHEKRISFSSCLNENEKVIICIIYNGKTETSLNQSIEKFFGSVKLKLSKNKITFNNIVALEATKIFRYNDVVLALELVEK